MNKYSYRLIPYEGKSIADVVKAENLTEAFNIIDKKYDLSSGLYKDVDIKLLRRNIWTGENYLQRL